MGTHPTPLSELVMGAIQVTTMTWQWRVQESNAVLQADHARIQELMQAELDFQAMRRSEAIIDSGKNRVPLCLLSVPITHKNQRPGARARLWWLASNGGVAVRMAAHSS
jgi:hypothetical protein